MQSGCYVNGCFLNKSSNAHAHYLLTLMILRNLISLRAFTVYMKISLRFEISHRPNWSKWNFHRSEFHFAWTHVNTDNEVTLHLSEISPRSEISYWFEFTSGHFMLQRYGNWTRLLRVKHCHKSHYRYSFTGTLKNDTLKFRILKVLCYLQFLKNTKFVRIVLNHF